MDLDPVVNKCPVTGIACHFERKILFMGVTFATSFGGGGITYKDFALFYIYICPSKIIYSLYSYINY